MTKWNVRYVAWATSQGRTPEKQSAFEKDETGVSDMLGFSQWLMRRWDEWRQLRGLKPRGIDHDYLTPGQYADSDAWVQTRAVELAGAPGGDAP